MLGKAVQAFATGLGIMCVTLVKELQRTSIELIDEIDKLKRGVPLTEEDLLANPYLNPRRKSCAKQREDRFCANYEAMGEFDDPWDLP